MVTLYVTTSVPMSTCVALGGSSACMVGSLSETCASSTLPWMKRMSGKKDLGVMLRAPSISFEGGVVGMVFTCAPATMPIPEALQY
jgi:hypothetical protein